MRKMNIGFIGLGGRGSWELDRILEMDDIEVVAVCDKHEDRMENGRKKCAARYGHEIAGSVDYRDVTRRTDIEAVIIPTYWNDHIEIAIDAMEHGIYAAFEVGPAQSVEQCWDLVRTYERTKIPCMLLENCCYNREEMTILNMIKKGVFGEVLHCEGGYQHDLRGDITNGFLRDHERTWHNLHRNGEIYPTHELGPIMTYLDINRGNRLVALNAMATKARGLDLYVKEHYDSNHKFANSHFQKGDVITTSIRTQNGETIVLTHCTSLPRPYSRGNRVDGTKGIWMEDKHAIHIEGISQGENWDPIENFYEEYEHPLWKKTAAGSFTGGHGGMDWLVLRAFLHSAREKIQTPIDVYDSATMMVISCLSEQSIALGSAPVAIPDFTNGKWIDRQPEPKNIFSLAEVDDSIFDDITEI